MNTCDSCKWWGKPSKEHNGRFRWCDCAMVDGSSMTIADEEPFSAGVIVTGPKFGCIHHEAARPVRMVPTGWNNLDGTPQFIPVPITEPK